MQRALGVQRAEPVEGGCISQCYRAVVAGCERFIKVNAAGAADLFAAEADGLRALAAAGVRAPTPLSHGMVGGFAYLVLEYLPLEDQGDAAAMGRMLARLHRVAGGERFGWHRDNYIGATAQRNGWRNDWAGFWAEQRIGPQIELARTKGFALRAPDVAGLLSGHRPTPALLHGDLWNGNVAFCGGEPVLYDPAVYYGDRETDLAMTELFGGFPRAFYAAYEAELPLDAGYEVRKRLYNLYHLLNHLNLFGGGYLEQVERELRFLRDAL